MKKILVITPTKFGLTDEELEAFRNRHYKLVYEAEKQLNEVCLRVNWFNSDFLKKDTLESKKEYFATCVDMLLDRATDYALFADGWENSEECKELRSIAEMFHVPILDMDNKENVS